MQPTSEMFLVKSALLWSLEDGGPVVAAVFKNPSEFIGRKFGITGDYTTVGEYAAVISKVTGKTVKYNQVPVEHILLSMVWTKMTCIYASTVAHYLMQTKCPLDVS